MRSIDSFECMPLKKENESCGFDDLECEPELLCPRRNNAARVKPENLLTRRGLPRDPDFDRRDGALNLECRVKETGAVCVLLLF